MQTGLSRQLVCLAAIRAARAEFFDRIIRIAEESSLSLREGGLSLVARRMLRTEGVAQIAELFFVFQERGINSPENFRAFIDRHNSDMLSRIKECNKGYSRYGVSERELRKCIFEEHQVDHIIHMSAAGHLSLDQRSIGKILREAMSFETCRTLLILLTQYGLLRRHDFRTVVLVSSGGVMESVYRDHLTLAVSMMSSKLEFAA